jgi:hypothetical protein
MRSIYKETVEKRQHLLNIKDFNTSTGEQRSYLLEDFAGNKTNTSNIKKGSMTRIIFKETSKNIITKPPPQTVFLPPKQRPTMLA